MKFEYHSPSWLAHTHSEGKWKPARHILFIEREILKALGRGNGKIIVNIPPRHGKSEYISKYFPAWYLTAYPARRVILCSYEASFAAEWGRKVRNIISELSLISGIEIDPAKKAADSFLIKHHGGGMICSGAGGSITGRGADLIIIDDPVKNDAEANSPVIRENIWNWFRATVFTRLEPGGTIILLMTRWHQDDLCGRIIAEFPKEWSIISIPAISASEDILGRTHGEALWSDRFPLPRLEEIKKAIGSFWFNSLYMQTPSPAGGAVFRYSFFRYFSEGASFYILQDGQRIPTFKCRTYAVADIASTLSEKSDYTVVIVFSTAPGNVILIREVIRERIEGAGHLQMIKSVHNKWTPLQIGIESVQYQASLVQIASREGLPVRPLRPDKDKLSRALPMAARVEAGDVYFLKNAHWLADFESELCSFPNGAHDDQTDAFAYIWQMISHSSGALASAGRKNISELG